MAKKFGLGAGLDALIGSAGSENSESISEKHESHTDLPQGIESDAEGKLWVRIDLLKPNPQQPRREFDEEKLKELADSIKEHGVIQPVTVESAGDGTFFIITGERRTRASKIAGLEKVPVMLSKFSEQKKLEIALIENIQRADLNAVEEAQAYYKLMELSGLTQEQVAERVGKNRSTVTNAIRLLKLPEDMLTALAQNKITAGHARAILSVKDKSEQQILFGKIIGAGLSVREAENLASELNSPAAKKSREKPSEKQDTRDPDFVELEEKFRNALGTKVVLKGDTNKGSLTIDYFSRDDLDRLYSKLIGKTE